MRGASGHQVSPPSRSSRRGGCLLAVVLIVACAYVLFVGPLFSIHEIDANVPPSSAEIAQAGVPLGANLLLFRTEPLESAIEADPLVESATVTRVLPHTVRIDTVLRKGCLRVEIAGASFEVDRNGVVFQAAAGDTLPLLYGADASVQLGGVVAKEAMDAVVPWLDALPRYDLPRVVKVHYLGDGKCNLALSDGRLVKVGTPANVDVKLAAAEALLARRWETAVEYVDVELWDQPVVGCKRPADTAPQHG